MLIGLVSMSDENYMAVDKEFKLSNFNFIFRSKIKNLLLGGCYKIATTLENTPKLKLVTETIQGKKGYFYVKRVETLINVAIFYSESGEDLSLSTDGIIQLLKEMAIEKNYVKLIKKYKDVNKFDPLYKVSKNLEDTKKTLVESLESVMKRSEALEEMDENLNRLGKMTEDFYKKAKKQNRYCWFF